MTNSRYIVRYHCHICGRMHLVKSQLPLPGGPTEPCTLADLYPDGKFPPSIIDSLTDSLYWCDQAGACVLIDESALVVPRPQAALHLNGANAHGPQS